MAATYSGEDISIHRLIARDGPACYLCGRDTEPRAQAGTPGKATIDHVVPLVNGGRHSLDNVRVACWACNAYKRTRSVAQVREERAARPKPRRPRRSPAAPQEADERLASATLDQEAVEGNGATAVRVALVGLVAAAGFVYIWSLMK
jgi:hypothetical protein